MKSILMSIQPKWCALIASGKKTVEFRKTKPKLDTPFKCYIYETKGEIELPHIDYDGYIRKIGGKVIGEFVCDKVDRMAHCGTNNNDISLKLVNERLYCTSIDSAYLNKCQLSYRDIVEYANHRDIYGWHISDLKIYDKPKDISEFGSICKEYNKIRPRCGNCEYYRSECNDSIGFFEDCLCDGFRYFARPPQSWCYVEEAVQ